MVNPVGANLEYSHLRGLPSHINGLFICVRGLLSHTSVPSSNLCRLFLGYMSPCDSSLKEKKLYSFKKKLYSTFTPEEFSFILFAASSTPLELEKNFITEKLLGTSAFKSKLNLSVNPT